MKQSCRLLRTGCQWKALPKERFVSASSIHSYFLQWTREGFFLQIWRAGLAEYDEPEDIDWKWQSSDGVMVKAPFCADRGYHGGPARKAIETRYYVPHVRQRGEEVEVKKTIPGYKPCRWIEEVAHSWFNRFRKLRVRYEKLRETYEALLHLAAAIICRRIIGVIYG